MIDRSPDRVGEDDLWAAVATTLRDVIGPVLPPGHERDVVVQLTGLATYARTRPDDDAPSRAARLASALDESADLGLAPLLARAGAALAARVESPTDPAAAAIAARVRPVVLQLLDEDITSAAPLLETFSGHPAADVEPVERVIEPAERLALERWFATKLAGPVAITRSAVMSGGHSRRMIRLTVAADGNPNELVVRIEQGGMFGTDGTTEAGAMQALAAAGVPIPLVRWIEPSRDPLGHPFFVMDFAAGRSEATPGSLDEFVRQLHALHGVDPAHLVESLGPVPTPEQAVDDAINRWSAIYRQSTRAAVPLLDEAIAWLQRNLRPTGRTVAVHGDPGPGNYLHIADRITAITDLEFVHYGDAAEDWAYLATIRARKLKSAADWYSHIEALTGVHQAPDEWRAWEAFNQFKGACANLTALRLFRDTPAKAPNLLAIGTAIHLRFVANLTALIDQDERATTA